MHGEVVTRIREIDIRASTVRTSVRAECRALGGLDRAEFVTAFKTCETGRAML